MPGKGFKSITVREEIYDYWERRFQQEKDRMIRETGHASFAAYMTKRLFDMREVDEIFAKIWKQYGDRMKKKGIFSLPALLEECIRSILEREKTKKDKI